MKMTISKPTSVQLGVYFNSHEVLLDLRDYGTVMVLKCIGVMTDV
jgi:hypothetical protein